MKPAGSSVTSCSKIRAAHTAAALVARLRDEILHLVLEGSDPGLCVVEQYQLEQHAQRFVE